MKRILITRMLITGGLIVGAIVALVVLLQRIGSNNMIYLTTDEFGPWATAAWINGDNWSYLVKLIPYYSYNYALILAVVYRLFDDPHRMYQAAVVFNALTTASIVPLAYLICCQLDTERRPLVHISIGLFCALTSANIVYSNLTWSEAWLNFISWIVLYMAVKLFSNPSVEGYMGPILFAFFLMMGYTTHQRFLGIVVAGLLSLIFLTIRKKMTLKQLFVTLAAIAVMLCIHRYFKNLIQEEVYLLSQRSGRLGNDYDSQLLRLLIIFKDNCVLCRTYFHVIGNFYYFGASTFLIGYLGICTVVMRLFHAWKNKLDTQVAFHAFILLGGLFEILIGAIALNYTDRVDYIIYGRYIEIVFGVYIIFGWETLLRFWVDKWSTVVAILIVPIAMFLCVSLPVQSRVNEVLKHEPEFQYVDCPAVAAYWLNGLRIADISVITISLFVLLAIMVLLLRQVSRNYAHPVVVAIISLIMTVNIVNALYINDEIVLKEKNRFALRNSYTIEMVKKWHREGNDWHFVYQGDTYLNNPRCPDAIQMRLVFLQFLLKNKPVIMCDYHSLSQKQLEHSNLFGADIYHEYIGQYSFYGEPSFFLMKKIEDAHYSPIDLRGFETEGTRTRNCLRSNRKVNKVLLKGPYMGISKGNYEVLFNCKSLDGWGEDALVRVNTSSAYAKKRTDGLKTLYHSFLKRKEFLGLSDFVQVNIPVHIDEDSSNFEVEMSTKGAMEVSDFKIMNRPQYLHYIEYKKFFIADKNIGVLEGRRDNGFVQFSGKNGIIMYGPYISLQPGFYELHIPVKLDPSQADRVGYKIVSYESGINYAHGSFNESLRPISDCPSDIANELKHAKDEVKSCFREAVIPFVVARKVDKVEFVLYAKDKIDLCVYNYTLKKAE